MRGLIYAVVLGWLAGTLGWMGWACAEPGGSASPSKSELVKIADVKVHLSDRGPVVLLQAEGRVVPIFVDVTVAGSIQGALTGEKLPRPMSHDLMHAIMTAYGGRVTQTVITLKGGTYYGALSVEFNGRETVFDSRSSDSIALAIHFHAPILIGREVLESAGAALPETKKQEL